MLVEGQAGARPGSVVRESGHGSTFSLLSLHQAQEAQLRTPLAFTVYLGSPEGGAGPKAGVPTQVLASG